MLAKFLFFLMANLKFILILFITVLIFVCIFSFIFYRKGIKQREKQIRQVYKKRDNNTVNDFILTPAADNSMEIVLTKKAYKKLRDQAIEGLLEGQKDKMIFRVRLS